MRVLAPGCSCRGPPARRRVPPLVRAPIPWSDATGLFSKGGSLVKNRKGFSEIFRYTAFRAPWPGQAPTRTTGTARPSLVTSSASDRGEEGREGRGHRSRMTDPSRPSLQLQAGRASGGARTTLTRPVGEPADGPKPWRHLLLDHARRRTRPKGHLQRWTPPLDRMRSGSPPQRHRAPTTGVYLDAFVSPARSAASPHLKD